MHGVYMNNMRFRRKPSVRTCLEWAGLRRGGLAVSVCGMACLQLTELVASPSTALTVGPFEAEVAEGETLVVLGIDGAALEALAHAVATGAGIAQGAVSLDDDPVFPGKARRNPIALLTGELPPAGRATVERHIEGALKSNGVPRDNWTERLDHALELTELSRHAQRRLADLTEAALLRVAVAAAVAWEPSALVCAQPLARLPTHLRPTLRLLIASLAHRCSMPVLLTATDSQEALCMADTLALLQGGRIVQQGPPLLLYKRPVNRAAADLLGEGNYLAATVKRTAAGFALVDTAAGPFRAVLPEGFEPGEGRQLTILIRPETLHIERMPADENTLTGRIAQVAYFGATARYLFESEGCTLSIRESNPRFAAPPPNELYAWVDAEDVIVLPG